MGETDFLSSPTPAQTQFLPRPLPNATLPLPSPALACCDAPKRTPRPRPRLLPPRTRTRRSPAPAVPPRRNPLRLLPLHLTPLNSKTALIVINSARADRLSTTIAEGREVPRALELVIAGEEESFTGLLVECASASNLGEATLGRVVLSLRDETGATNDDVSEDGTDEGDLGEALVDALERLSLRSFSVRSERSKPVSASVDSFER